MAAPKVNRVIDLRKNIARRESIALGQRSHLRWHFQLEALMWGYPAQNAAPTAADDESRKAAIKAAKKAARDKFGDAPLPINPATGKRWINTGRAPSTGFHTPILDRQAKPSSRPDMAWRFRTRRERAVELQERMQRFSAIYNAGWLVRDAYFGSDARRKAAVMKLIATLLQEMRGTEDFEALMFALADTLYASSLGVPWEP